MGTIIAIGAGIAVLAGLGAGVGIGVAVSFILSMSEVGLVISYGILKKVWISDSQKSWFSICIWVYL